MKFVVLPTPKKTAVFAEATAATANKTPKKSAGESFEHVAPRTLLPNHTSVGILESRAFSLLAARYHGDPAVYFSRDCSVQLLKD